MNGEEKGKETPPMSAQTVEERLASIEATLPHLATKADIERLQTVMIKWFVGIGLAAAAVAATIASIIVTWAT